MNIFHCILEPVVMKKLRLILIWPIMQHTLKAKVDKLDIRKLVTVPADLAKLSNKVQSNQTKNETELSI